MAICLDFDRQTNEFMFYCRTTQLRVKTMLELHVLWLQQSDRFQV